MTRETKVGLLVGMGVILLIGIIISDHLAAVNEQKPADEAMAEFAQRAQDSINSMIEEPTRGTRPAPTSVARQEPSVLQRVQPVPTPGEIAPPRWQADEAVTPVQAAPEMPRAYQLAEGSPVAAGVTQAGGRVEPVSVVPTLTLSHQVPTAPTIHPSRQQVSATDWHPQDDQHSVLTETSDEAAAGGDGAQANRLARSEIIHYVKPGETLYEIAQRYYGDGEYWRTIADYNRGRVKPNGQVNENVRLVLPNKAGLAKLGPDFIPVSSDAPQVPNRQPERSARTIQVQAGDTLIKLAERHLGSAGKWKELLDANRDKLDRPEALRVGMKLAFPTSASPVTAPVETDSSSRSRASGEYTVQAGDTLSRIAAKTLGDADRWEELYEANRDTLKNPDAVVVGQSLRIPR